MEPVGEGHYGKVYRQGEGVVKEQPFDSTSLCLVELAALAAVQGMPGAPKQTAPPSWEKNLETMRLSMAHHGDNLLAWGKTRTPAERGAAAPAVLCQLLRAACLMHRRGVVHNDLHPRNLLMARGRLTVVDFGGAMFRFARPVAKSYLDKLERAIFSPPDEHLDHESMVYTIAYSVVWFVLGSCPMWDESAMKRALKAGQGQARPEDELALQALDKKDTDRLRGYVAGWVYDLLVRMMCAERRHRPRLEDLAAFPLFPRWRPPAAPDYAVGGAPWPPRERHAFVVSMATPRGCEGVYLYIVDAYRAARGALPPPGAVEQLVDALAECKEVSAPAAIVDVLRAVPAPYVRALDIVASEKGIYNRELCVAVWACHPPPYEGGQLMAAYLALCRSWKKGDPVGFAPDGERLRPVRVAEADRWKIVEQEL